MRRLGGWAVALLAFASLGFALRIASLHAYDRPPIPEARQPLHLRLRGTAVRIALVGDSWVAGHKLDAAIVREFDSRGYRPTVVSSGHPGATSKEILRDLTSEDRPYSAVHLLDASRFDCLVVVAGVNDTLAHMGAAFYAHHMVTIARLAASRGVLPVLVEVPTYGVHHTPAPSLVVALRGALFRVLFERGGEVVDDYRQALRAALRQAGVPHVLVSGESVASAYSGSEYLFRNPSHLNDMGSALLGRAIARAIEAALEDAPHAVTSGAWTPGR